MDSPKYRLDRISRISRRDFDEEKFERLGIAPSRTWGRLAAVAGSSRVRDSLHTLGYILACHGRALHLEFGSVDLSRCDADDLGHLSSFSLLVWQLLSVFFNISVAAVVVDLDHLNLTDGLFDLLHGFLDQRVDHGVDQVLVWLLQEFGRAEGV